MLNRGTQQNNCRKKISAKALFALISQLFNCFLFSSHHLEAGLDPFSLLFHHLLRAGLGPFRSVPAPPTTRGRVPSGVFLNTFDAGLGPFCFFLNTFDAGLGPFRFALTTS